MMGGGIQGSERNERRSVTSCIAKCIVQSSPTSAADRFTSAKCEFEILQTNINDVEARLLVVWLVNPARHHDVQVICKYGKYGPRHHLQ